MHLELVFQIIDACSNAFDSVNMRPGGPDRVYRPAAAPHLVAQPCNGLATLAHLMLQLVPFSGQVLNLHQIPLTHGGTWLCAELKSSKLSV